MKLSKIAICSIILTTISLFGCSYHAKWTYPDNPSALNILYQKPQFPYRVAVLPFEEKRGRSNEFSTMWLYLIPLSPYGYVKYERPEAAKMFNTIRDYDFEMDEDISKAVVTSLKKANLFEDVYFAYGGILPDTDFVIGGDLERMTYKGKQYSYCLSVAGPLLWFLGLPAGSNYNNLAISMYLKRVDSDEVLWSYSFEKDWSIIGGLYYNWGKDAKGFPINMQEGMNEAVQDLAEKIKNMKF